MHETKIIAKGAIFVFIGIVISKILTYIWRVFIARYIGQEAYGIFSIAFALLGIVNVFAALGFSDGLFRYTSFYFARKKYGDAKGVLLSVFSINFISSLFVCFILVFFSRVIAQYFFHNINLIWHVWIVAATLPFYVFSNHFLNLLNTKLRADYNAFIKNIIEGIVKILATILFVYFGYSTLAAILGYFVATIGTFILAAYFLFFKTNYGIILKSKAKYHYREIISYSIPLMITGFVTIFLSYTDTMMLGYFKGIIQTGILSGSALMAIKKQNIILATTICGSVLNLILNYFLIPLFGIVGAATATAISIIFIYSLYLFFVYKYLKFFPFTINQLKAFFAAIFAFIFTYFFIKLIFPITPIWVLIPALCFYICVYVFIMLKFKIIDDDDLKLLNLLKRKIILKLY
ncbi:MAG: hypothetical protein B6U87_01310 [Candidatus Aenigmarchaeota archaeon ex4484_52]|nr:MAG: hypothetical protein B6U87_01310 [Candidatus Aenigmarchaeota archaeon ex4484_52]